MTRPSSKAALSYDQELLRADLARVVHAAWDEAGYPGEGHLAWKSLTLLSAVSEPPQAPALAQAPYLRRLLEELPCNVRLARLMALEPGGAIALHSDGFLAEKVARLHLPIVTHPDVELFVDGQRCAWQHGELWFADFSRPHHGRNPTQVTRVHLVLDVTVDAALRRLFPESFSAVEASSPAEQPSVLGADVQRRFQFRFELPAGFHLPGTGFHPLPSRALGSVHLVDQQLFLYLNEQPMLELRVRSEDTLEVLGLPVEALVECEFRSGKVTHATLVTERGRGRLPLAVATEWSGQ